MVASEQTTAAARLRLEIQGAVQGVGFRPFVYRLAAECGLAGWVLNGPAGVVVEAEGARADLERFAARVEREAPRAARVVEVARRWLAPEGARGFSIRHSDGDGAKRVQVLPDLATCPECLAELRDPADRRHRYPFTNCTNCGPRFTIVEALPYDRPNTTMRGFALCPACRAEYEQPLDRRFHAQPNACPACGPRLELRDRSGARLALREEALALAADAIREGMVVAVKGLGGFQLVCDARNEAAVFALRARKGRRRKPFALMVRDLAMAEALCEVPREAAELLAAPEAPIVLLERRGGNPQIAPISGPVGLERRGVTGDATDAQGGPEPPFGSGSGTPEHGPAEARHAVDTSCGSADAFPIAPSVAPGSPTLGLMLPTTPLHHLLLGDLGFPVVATSGNLSDEPICTDEAEAAARLGAIADLLLVHDRPIARHADDSVAVVLHGEPRLLRRARGYAPAPVLLRGEAPCVLGVGAQLKSAVALAVGRQVVIGQHIGDLDAPEARAAFERAVADLVRLYEASPVAVAHDLHPDYFSTAFAHELAARPAPHAPRLVAVQHHHAHLAAALAEHQHEGPALGVIWDGTGYGPDGTIWGGEFLLGDVAGSERVAHLRPFPLPGGDAAAREPRRAALALLHELEGPAALARDDLPPLRAFAPSERAVLARMIERGLNCVPTSSAGRLFDGVAALLGLCQRSSFEGEAAMLLEHATDPAERAAYPVELVGATLDWRPAVAAALDDRRRGVAVGRISARFHNGLLAAILAVVRRAAPPAVALSGGCFQNRLLAGRAAAAVEGLGVPALLHRLVPPNDGGISLGQVAAAAARLRA